MQDSGLNVIWIESDLLVENTAVHVMCGKDYAKGTHAQTITLHTMWQLLLSQLLSYLQQHAVDLRRRLLRLARLDTTPENDEIVNILTMETFHEHMASFVEMNQGRNPNFQLWWQYMQMVGVPPLCIRAKRDGTWNLHLYSIGH